MGCCEHGNDVTTCSLVDFTDVYKEPVWSSETSVTTRKSLQPRRQPPTSHDNETFRVEINLNETGRRLD